MKFVTKEEFEKAVATLKQAVKNGQVRYGHYDNTEEMAGVLFSSMGNMSLVDASHATFVPPATAAQAKLFIVRNRLNRYRQEHSVRSKELEDLEKTEKELAKSLASLKE
ncbi:MAG TPA: hypothetical protein VN855_00585 [Candidatus Acidoferrum sp.]|nr:hypothetical protein [Candidatus Acidoferrum sp.]